VVKLTHEVQSVYRVQEYGAAPTIDGVVTVGLRRFRDDGGAMLELLRFGEKRPPGLEGFEPAQINYSTVEPGSIKAFHVHLRQTDVWFVPPEDRILLVLVDVREESSTAGRQVRMLLGDGQPELVRIPPGVAHGCRNLGREPARIIYFSDLAFVPDPEHCDEGRLPWDLVGPDVWEVARE
jgi:dTDP-4-dehydrorhamnose 3,5-epimerase